MRNLVLAAALAALAGPAAGALPSAPPAKAMTCPIGGGSFDYQPGAAAQVVLGERPDGRPIGGVKFPLPLPECPGNGLVLYKDYNAGEVAKLEPLVASEAYQALRKDDTQYYRAYWLMRKLDVGPELYLWALLQASWEADGRPELRKRYLEELVEASAKVPARPADINWIGMEGRSINALRELGRFDEALARLDKVPLSALGAAVPVSASAPETPQARVRRGWRTFFTAIRPVIERRDSSSEPLDLLPRSVAAGRCIDEAGKLDEIGRAYCEKDAEAIAAVRIAREKQAKEDEALRQSREASGR